MKNDNTEKEKKAGSPIFILIMFVAIIGFVLYIPDIYTKYNTEIAKFFGFTPSNDTNLNNGNDENSATSDYSQIKSGNTLDYKEITIKNVTLDDGTLKFTISTNETVDLDKKGYYLEFYKDKAEFLGRRILTGTVTSTKKYEIDVSNMDITNDTYMIISHVDDSTIPSINRLSTDESGLGSIVCKSGSYEYKYTFHQESLIKVTKKYTYENTDLSEFSNELFKYQKLVKEYNDLTGVTASVAESNTTFIYTLELNYEEVSTFRIEDAYKFNKDNKANVVKYKMEAEGFDCE